MNIYNGHALWTKQSTDRIDSTTIHIVLSLTGE